MGYTAKIVEITPSVLPNARKNVLLILCQECNAKPSGKILQTVVYDDCESVCEQWSRRANGHKFLNIKGSVRSHGFSCYGCNASSVEGKQQSVRSCRRMEMQAFVVK